MSAPSTDLAFLYTTERKRLQRMIQRIVKNEATAEDVAQDAFVKLSDRTSGSSNLGLLFQTARNLALDHLRARRVRSRFAQSHENAGEADESPLQDRALEASQQLNSLLQALQALPQRTQKIFLMSRLDGLSQAQIANELGLSISLIEKEMIKALAFCRAWQKELDRP